MSRILVPHIWVPKFKIIEAKQPLTVRAGVRGFYKLEAVKPDGRRRLLADWFPNLITNVGLNRVGTASDYMNVCQVGAGNTTPAFTDTALASFVGSSSSIFSTNRSIQATAPYYTTVTRVYRFNAGVADGNLQEIAITNSTVNGGATIMFSRALILDGSGLPTTITVQPDEVLDATYQLRLYAPTADVLGTVNVNGVDHDTVVRACEVNSLSRWSLPADAGGGGLNTNNMFGNGSLGTVLQQPNTSGGSAGVSASINAYNDNTLIRSKVLSAGLDTANFAGGINVARSDIGGAGSNACFGSLQCSFTPAIPKDNTMTLSMVFSTAWGRATI